MVEETKKLLKIDLNQFKLYIYLKPEVELTLHFDTPSRRFYLSVIALLIHEMKKQGRNLSIPLQKHMDVLALLNETVGEKAGSSKKKQLLSRIYRKWKDSLPDLENAPLFKVVGRKKKYDESMDRIYHFSEEEKDIWANLFEYRGSHENVRLKFSIEHLDIHPADTIILFGEYPEKADVNAWERFIEHLKNKETEKLLSEHTAQQFELLSTFSQTTSLPKAMPKRLKWLATSIATALVVGITLLAIWHEDIFPPQIKPASIDKMVFSLPEKPSIAVLPFQSLNEDKKTGYFSIGLTEDIINGLSKIRSLFVISTGSMLTYKEGPVEIRKVAEDLGVRFVLRGSVRMDADELKITVQLIDAVKGILLWAERYDRELKDIFSVQDEISINVLKMLQVALLARDKARLSENRTSNLQAYLKVIEGRMDMYNFKFNESLKCFEEARLLDNRYIDAYAYEAFAHLNNFWLGLSKNRWQSLIKAKEIVKKCEVLSNEITSCNMVNAAICTAELDCFNALNEGKQVVEYWPNSSQAATIFALILQNCGKYEEAIGQIQKALRINPYRVELPWSVLGRTYFNMERYEEAIEISNKLIEIHPFFLPALMTLALSYGSLGHMGEAAAVVKKIWKIRPNFSAKDFAFSFYKTEKDINHILDGLLFAEPKQEENGR